MKSLGPAIHDIMDWMDHGVTERVRPSGDKVVYYGYPAFYFFHSRGEAEELVRQRLTSDKYDEFLLCRELLIVLKFLLGLYDSHTNVVSLSNRMTLFGDLWIESDHVYIAACP